MILNSTEPFDDVKDFNETKVIASLFSSLRDSWPTLCYKANFFKIPKKITNKNNKIFLSFLITVY